MRTTTLPPWVIEALAALPPGVEALVVLPVEPQESPRAVGERGVVTGPAAAPGGAVVQFGGGRGYAGVHMEVQFCPLGAVGERVAVLEEWVVPRVSSWSGCVLVQTKSGETHTQRADCLEYNDRYIGCGWQPAETMPVWASRLHIRLTAEPEVKRVGEMTEEAHRIGLDSCIDGEIGKDLALNRFRKKMAR